MCFIVHPKEQLLNPEVEACVAPELLKATAGNRAAFTPRM